MREGLHRDILKIIYSPQIEDTLRQFKRGNQNFFNRTEKQILKILKEPNIGKPLRYTLKNRRRIHICSYVLVYEFHQGELRFLDIDHHDRIYKKFK